MSLPWTNQGEESVNLIFHVHVPMKSILISEIDLLTGEQFSFGEDSSFHIGERFVQPLDSIELVLINYFLLALKGLRRGEI